MRWAKPILEVTKSTRKKLITYIQHTSYDKIRYNVELKIKSEKLKCKDSENI